MEICHECCSQEHDEPMPQAIEHDPNDPVTQDAILIASLVRGRADNACMPIVTQPTDQRGAPRRPDCNGAQRQPATPCFRRPAAAV